MPEAVERVRPSRSAAIHEAAALFADRRYQKLLGKAIGTGLAVGRLGRLAPGYAVPLALLGGMYIGLELAAYLAEQAEDRGAIDAASVVRRVVPINPPPEVTDA